jgi:polar amino acid transport system ATP-binding protein
VTSGVLEMSAVSKGYGALRPLRIERLVVASDEQVALFGLDQPAAEVFINLVTGASLPDSGDVHVFDRSTADIRDSEDWLATLDRFGIVSDRAALLEPLSVIQNLALPFSLDIEPPPDSVRSQAVALAREVRIPEGAFERPVGELDGAGRVRLRLGRALAMNPRLLLLEHPTAAVPAADRAQLGRDIRAVVSARHTAAVAITGDQDFAREVAVRRLALEPATGRLRPQR